MPGNTCTCNCKCNADVIDLTADSDEEPIESSRNYSGYNLRKRNQQSRQARKSSDIEVTKATIQNSCPVCLKKFESIKSEGGRLQVLIQCGHVICFTCLKMMEKTRAKSLPNGLRYLDCPTCRTNVRHHCGVRL